MNYCVNCILDIFFSKSNLIKRKLLIEEIVNLLLVPIGIMRFLFAISKDKLHFPFFHEIQDSLFVIVLLWPFSLFEFRVLVLQFIVNASNNAIEFLNSGLHLNEDNIEAKYWSGCLPFWIAPQDQEEVSFLLALPFWQVLVDFGPF